MALVDKTLLGDLKAPSSPNHSVRAAPKVLFRWKGKGAEQGGDIFKVRADASAANG